MQLEVHSGAAAFIDLADDWHRLIARSAHATPFQTLEFQRAWWEGLGEGELRVLALRAADHSLHGLAALYVDLAGVLRWVGGEEIADYLDVITTKTNAPEVRAAVLDWWLGPHAPTWQYAQLSNIPEASQTIAQWQQQAAQSGWRTAVERLDVCPVATLPASFDDYIAQLDSKQRHELRRKLRRAQAESAQWRLLPGGADVSAASEELMRLMAASSPAKTLFLTPEIRATYHKIFRAAAATGLFNLCFLDADQRAIAVYAYFTMNQRIYLYNSGYDPAYASALSPGWVLLAHLIEHAIATGHTHFDFMQGAEDYKYKFGGRDEHVVRLTLQRS